MMSLGPRLMSVRGERRCSTWLALHALLALSVLAHPLRAQGVTSAAMQGRVLGSDGSAVSGAVVRVTSMSSGASWQVGTDAAGRYFLEHVAPGGPYTADVRRIGFTPGRREGITLGLGQRLHADFILVPVIRSLDTVVIATRVDPFSNAGRTGPEHIVSEEELRALPNFSRDLSVVAGLAPLAVLRPLGGISVGAQNQGFNSLQVDGGVHADLYLGRSPGGASPSGALPEVLPHSMSIETVGEFQVLAAPFDVRFGNFAGGLLNAVTKSGTNRRQASIFAFVQDGSLAGRNAAGRRSNFTTWQFGGTASGPVVRDRVHFFANADLQERVVPDPGPWLVEPGAPGITENDLAEFERILGKHGLNGGTRISDGRLPAQDLFAKITAQLNARNRLEISQHYAHGRREGFMDAGRTPDSVGLSSVAGLSRSTAQTSRLIWNALLRDRVQSEVILSYERLRDSCTPNETFPLVQVKVGRAGLVAGPNSVCPTTDVDQNALEMTGNLTVGTGSHLLTLGAHAQLLHFRDPLLQVSAGRWDFLSLRDFETGTAVHYDRGLPAPPPRSAGVDFGVMTLGGYAQDRWTPSARVALTLGLRVDLPIMRDSARTNPDLLDRGIDTGRLPSGALLWSPRLGVTYDWRGDGNTFLRGGVGVFAGPPPWRWLGNAYRDTGDEMLVSCDRLATPPFTPRNQPTSCVGGGGTSRRVSYFEPGFSFPQNLKAALGIDHRLPFDMVATFDVLYTRAIRQVYIDQANLRPSSSVAEGEGQRPLYGTVAPDGRSLIPNWIHTTALVTEVYRLSNASGDHSVALSAQLRKRFGELIGIHASYTHSRARDRMSLVNFPARANFSNTPLGGTQDHRPLRPSFFDTPHKLAIAASYGRADRTQLTLVYSGASQPPYTFVINGDANGDGIGGSGSLKNDIVYVPLDETDISLVGPTGYDSLHTFIEQTPCLREQRGRIMARGSCRNPWLGTLNGRLTTMLPVTGDRRRLEITADVFNIPNLLSGRWGRQRDITTGPSVTLLTLDSLEVGKERGRYALRLPPDGVVDQASRWRIQIGARYHFAAPASPAQR